MHLSKKQLAILALIVANVIWGASPPLFKWSLQAIPPFTFIFIRFFLATLILLPFTMHSLRIAKKDISKIVTLAYVGFTLHITTVFLGLTLAPSINASIISSTAPVFLIVGGYFMLREKLKRKTLLGTLLSLIGILTIIVQPVLGTSFDGSLLGNVLFLISNVSFVLYTILLKEFKLPYSPLTITFWVFAIASISFFPLYLWESGMHSFSLPLQGLIGILFGAVFTSITAYMLFTFAVKYIHASEIGIFLYVDPIVTVLIAIPLLSEKITVPFVFGSLLVFLGIFIAEGRLHYHPLHRLRHADE